MADVKTINTRIVLRNDELSAWEESEKQLLKGEVAFARLSGTNDFEMRIGTGDKTWNQLSGSNVVVPDSTKFYEVTLTSQVALADKVNALSDYNANAKNGDIGVVKELIADGKYSHTAYRWNKATASWVALDGNYSANNVIFSENISAMYTFGKYSGTITKPVSLNTVGKSVATLFSEALQEIKTPNSVKTNPSFATSTYSSSLTGEIGTYKTLPKFSAKFSDGAYEYGPATTGSKIEVGKAFLSAAQGATSTVTNTSVLTDGKEIEIAADSNTKVQVLSSAQSNYWKWQLSATWTDGDKQWNSINVVADDAPYIKSGTQALTTKNCSISAGYYPHYEACFSTKVIADPANITSADIITMTNNIPTANTGWTKTVNSTQKSASITSWTNKNMQQWFWVAKAGKISNVTVTQQSPEAPHTVLKTSVTLPTANNYQDVVYDVWYVSNPNAINNGYKVTIS